jgi:hypothetical protein
MWCRTIPKCDPSGLLERSFHFPHASASLSKGRLLTRAAHLGHRVTSRDRNGAGFAAVG